MSKRDNPFSTRYIQPGAIPYQLFGGESFDHLIQRYCHDLHWRGAIVGPHGVGKSTLLEALVPRLGVVVRYMDFGKATERDAVGQESHRSRSLDDSTQTPVHWYRLSASNAHSMRLLREAKSVPKGGLMVIDGFEQLSRVVRFWFAFHAWWKRDKLLVTCHAPTLGIPVLLRVSIGQESAEYAVRYLLRDQPDLADKILRSATYRELRTKWGDNLRELLFELYDRYEDGQEFL